MSDRVVVFLDYQNVYKGARSAFHDPWGDPHWNGQIDPLALGAHIAADSPFDRELAQVRISAASRSTTVIPKDMRRVGGNMRRGRPIRGFTW